MRILLVAAFVLCAAAGVARAQLPPTAPFDVIPFETGSAELEGVDPARLAAAVEWVQADPGRRIVIEGHADRRGSERRNRRLAEQRAMTVHDALVAQGADPRSLVVVIYGEADPVSDVPADNRRVWLWGTSLVGEGPST